MATTEDYLGRITPWHRGRPKFAAVVALSVQPFVDLQNFLAALPQAFDLDTAIGVQLDKVGEWIGRSRYVATPLTSVYFSFDIANLGFDQAVWKGPFDADEGLTALDDENYRILLRAKIAANNWSGVTEDAEHILQTLIGGGTYVFVTDNLDMTMSVNIAGAWPNAVVLALLTKGYLPLKPSGVELDYYVTSIDGAPLFGFDVENEKISGFDTGAWGVGPDSLAGAGVGQPGEWDDSLIWDGAVWT